MFFKRFPRKAALNRIKKDSCSYLSKFSARLEVHFETEFEVQIREGKITVEGEETLKALRNDFNILQYKDEISKIVVKQKKLTKRFLKKHPSLFALLDVVHDDLIECCENIIKRVQTMVLRERRKNDNKLCNEKCLLGPSVFNFTSTEIPTELLTQLKNGLSTVPQLKSDVDKMIPEIEDEVIQACKACFNKYYGYFPYTTKKQSFDSSIKEILSQCMSRVSQSLVYCIGILNPLV